MQDGNVPQHTQSLDNFFDVKENIKAEKIIIVVIIATIGRPAELESTISALLQQTCVPDEIIISAVDNKDIGNACNYEKVMILLGTAGSCVQRNRALDSISPDPDIICFFDDDYLPSRYAIEGIRRLFSEHPNVAGSTGYLIADGVNSHGISLQAAEKIVDEYDLKPKKEIYTIKQSSIGLYGCNMAFRRTAILGERFDENLPLYGWQEDIDFATRVSKRGSLISTNIFAGVHLGVKKGRSSGLRVGYSQIANPIYLVKKGTMPFPFACKLIFKNVAANIAKAAFPEPWLDRWGRLRGNMFAVRDLLNGKLDPSRILGLK